jgi:hypothetical protein
MGGEIISGLFEPVRIVSSDLVPVREGFHVEQIACRGFGHAVLPPVKPS